MHTSNVPCLREVWCWVVVSVGRGPVMTHGRIVPSLTGSGHLVRTFSCRKAFAFEALCALEVLSGCYCLFTLYTGPGAVHIPRIGSHSSPACHPPQWIVYPPGGGSFPNIANGAAYEATILQQGGTEALRQWRELDRAMKPLQVGCRAAAQFLCGGVTKLRRGGYGAFR